MVRIDDPSMTASTRQDAAQSTGAAASQAGRANDALPPSRRFTSAEWRAIVEAGVFPEDERLELIAGEIVSMTPIGTRHAYCLALFARLLSRVLDDSYLVWTQSPITLEDGQQPQPDIAILKPRDDSYAKSLPRPEDIALVIEIADSSLRLDREVKAPIYARAGIRETWIVDLAGNVVETLSEPMSGRYAHRDFIDRGGVLRPVALPQIRLAAKDIFG